MQGTEQLRIVTVGALVSMLLAHRLPLGAGMAQELETHRVTTRYQASGHASTTARERAALHAPAAVVLQWSMCALTLVDALIANEGQAARPAANSHICRHSQQHSARQPDTTRARCTTPVRMLLCSFTSACAVVRVRAVTM